MNHKNFNKNYKEEYEKDEFRLPIPVQTYDLGPHEKRVYLLPSVKEKKYSTWIWVIAAIIVGISVSHFTFDIGKQTVAFLIEKGTVAYVATTENTVKEVVSNVSEYQGSDDHLVYENVSDESGGYYLKAEDSKLPRTNGLAYIVADAETGDVIFQKNADLIIPIASVSKLMAAIVSKEVLDQHKSVTVNRSSVDTYGSMGGLRAGEKILVTDLMYPLLIESSNDAAEVLAEAYGRKAFLLEMNEKAEELGMNSTNYDDPSGLSSKNVSNCYDLLKLAIHIDKVYPELWDITRVREYSILGHSWVNASRLAKKSSYIGGKNGYTE